MRRNICVAFVPLPHHHVQVQLFLFSDLPLIPLIDPPSPQPSLFIFQSHIFPSFLLLNSSTSHILSWLFVALLQCTPPFYTWLIVAWHVLFCTTFSCGSIILSWLFVALLQCTPPHSTWLIVACGMMFCFVLLLLVVLSMSHTSLLHDVLVKAILAVKLFIR